ncbi:MAG: Ldh family oxidoreductase [Hellea sp.]|nr:Ldh family oxidoreductase [Hellea sp.]
MSNQVMTVEAIRTLAHDTLKKFGADDLNAAAVAKTITKAERDGCVSHGLFRLPGYVATLKSGKVDGNARPTVKSLAPAVVQVNGHNCFAPSAVQEGRAALIEATNTCGIAIMPMIGVHHFAALWPDLEEICDAGLAAFACVSYKPSVIPAGGKKALYGTNPIAFGWPRPGKSPMIFDMATAVMARGEVGIAARDGHAIPDGVGVDADGNPTSDPNEILKGALLAFGGYKGSSISMMVELLAGAMIGESFSFEAAIRDNSDGGPPQGGEFLFAINPTLVRGNDGWGDHAEGFFDKIYEQDGTRLPGDRRYQNRAKHDRDGVEVSQIILDKIKAL